jgi:hypothetical protein
LSLRISEATSPKRFDLSGIIRRTNSSFRPLGDTRRPGT